MTRSRVSQTVNYPDPVLENPNGWNVGVKSKVVQNIVSTADDVKVVTSAGAVAKLAPAIAMAATNTLTAAPTAAYTSAQAVARPGSQYGVTLASSDQHMVNLSECNSHPHPTPQCVQPWCLLSPGVCFTAHV